MVKSAQLALLLNISIRPLKLVKIAPKLKNLIQVRKLVNALITISGMIRNVFLVSSQNTLISQLRLANLVLQDSFMI
jgi:hypothetical protein